MALYTALEMAETYQTALIAIISGKVANYSIGDTSFSRLNIKDLEDAYNYWRKQADIAANGSNVLHAQVTNLDITPADVTEIVDE